MELSTNANSLRQFLSFLNIILKMLNLVSYDGLKTIFALGRGQLAVNLLILLIFYSLTLSCLFSLFLPICFSVAYMHMLLQLCTWYWITN